MQTNTTPITVRKRIALVAHDNKKQDLLEWARYNRDLLVQHDLCATGTTGMLVELALDFARQTLRPGGDFLVKVFQGSGLAELQKAMAGHFTKVYVRKPKASRDRSRETFLVAKGLRG